MGYFLLCWRNDFRHSEILDYLVITGSHFRNFPICVLIAVILKNTDNFSASVLFARSIALNSQ